jgi:hypothetical protein
VENARQQPLTWDCPVPIDLSERTPLACILFLFVVLGDMTLTVAQPALEPLINESVVIGGTAAF